MVWKTNWTEFKLWTIQFEFLKIKTKLTFSLLYNPKIPHTYNSNDNDNSNLKNTTTLLIVLYIFVQLAVFPVDASEVGSDKQEI